MPHAVRGSKPSLAHHCKRAPSLIAKSNAENWREESVGGQRSKRIENQEGGGRREEFQACERNCFQGYDPWVEEIPSAGDRTARERGDTFEGNSGHDSKEITSFPILDHAVRVQWSRSAGALQQRSGCSRFVLVVGHGLEARGGFRPCLSFMNFSPSHSPPDAPSSPLLSLSSQTPDEYCYQYHRAWNLLLCEA